MLLEDEEIEKIAHLARLGIDAQDIPGYAQNLSDILGLVEQMNSVDTSQIEPMSHPVELVQRLRADAVTESDEREVFQKIAPSVEKGLYLVPQVIE
jgi:aspartyl-tRNA(Asn)/glutamyl-tRNA(Gln) amidotransferase subunit C